MSDLDAKIVAARVSGVSEGEICDRFGCTMERARAVLDASAERMLTPENVQRMLIESLGTFGAIQRTLAAKGDKALVRQCRRQRARTAKLILERAPTSNPV